MDTNGYNYFIDFRKSSDSSILSDISKFQLFTNSKPFLDFDWNFIQTITIEVLMIRKPVDFQSNNKRSNNWDLDRKTNYCKTYQRTSRKGVHIPYLWLQFRIPIDVFRRGWDVYRAVMTRDHFLLLPNKIFHLKFFLKTI